MAKKEYEFTLIFSGVRELTREVLDALFEAGCDDALFGVRDGIAFGDFCRQADTFEKAALSAIRDVEGAGIGAKIELVEPDELVTMSEIARRLRLSREGVRKWVAGLRGSGNFPPPVGGLTRRSPLWRWTDVIQWHKNRSPNTIKMQDLGTNIAAINSALDLRRRVSVEVAVKLLQKIASPKKMAKSK